uniref:Uncharacterized protein n=1 Tax=Setaria digitata TaxID=48799 RepID=A0A915PWR3_9BILA
MRTTRHKYACKHAVDPHSYVRVRYACAGMLALQKMLAVVERYALFSALIVVSHGDRDRFEMKGTVNNRPESKLAW